MAIKNHVNFLNPNAQHNLANILFSFLFAHFVVEKVIRANNLFVASVANIKSLKKRGSLKAMYLTRSKFFKKEKV